MQDGFQGLKVTFLHSRWVPFWDQGCFGGSKDGLRKLSGWLRPTLSRLTYAQTRWLLRPTLSRLAAQTYPEQAARSDQLAAQTDPCPMPCPCHCPCLMAGICQGQCGRVINVSIRNPLFVSLSDLHRQGAKAYVRKRYREDCIPLLTVAILAQGSKQAQAAGLAESRVRGCPF